MSAAPNPCLNATTQPASRVPDMQPQFEDFNLLSDGIASFNSQHATQYCRTMLRHNMSQQ